MRFVAPVLAALLMVAAAPPAVAADGHVDLIITALLSQPAYLPTDTVTMEVTIVNAGTATATGVVVRSDGDLDFTPWGELGGAGVEIPPQGDVTVTVTAPPNDDGDGMTERLEAVSAEPDHNPADNVATVDTFVTAKQAELTVTLYGDVDHDGVVDAGETRSGVLVTLTGGLNAEEFTARTDAAGVARFPTLTGGLYSAMVGLPKGWYVDGPQRIRVRAGSNTATIRAILNDLSKLSASVSLDRATYAPGDAIRERVTLTNSGKADITGLVAHCGGWDIGLYMLRSTGWGDLAVDGTGVTVRAGETRMWEFTDVVPDEATRYGYVMLWCDFSPSRGSDGPVAEARPAVPGGPGTAVGTVVDPAEKPLPGIKFLLIDRVTGAVVTRVVSDGAGLLQIALPAGLYELRPLGPWRIDQVPEFLVQVIAGQSLDYTPIILAPGPMQADPGEVRPKLSTVDVVPAPPAPQAERPVRPENLASTGANVQELAAIGFLLVMVGAGLLLVRRRTT